MPIYGFLPDYPISFCEGSDRLQLLWRPSAIRGGVSVCVALSYSCGDTASVRAVIKDGVPGQEEAPFCHRTEQTPKQVRKIGQREKERTCLQPMLFPPEEAKLVGPRETNPLLAAVRVSLSLSLVITIRIILRS